MARQGSPIVRWMAWLAAWVFYRVDRVGRVPASGAVIILPNHPNALLDPAVVWATAGRDVRFLAKSGLFGGAFGAVMRAAGAIPVYRRIDQGVDVARNAEMFEAVGAALADGDAVCIFPEGISHSSGRLEPLRTGAARMALSAEAQGTPVALVPVGLNFDRKATFRSRVTVMYGPAFDASDLLAAFRAEPPRAVRALTDRIADRIRQLVVEADPIADAALIDRVDRLYVAAREVAPDPAERVARRRVIAAGMERLRASHPERYAGVLLKIHRYDERLRRFGLRDRHLDWHVPARDAAVFAARELALGLVLVPLCLAGLALFCVPYYVTGFVARRIARERDVVATAQIFAGAAVYVAWIAALSALAWRWAGTEAALLAGCVLPGLAVAALVAIERETAVVDAIRAWYLLGRSRGATRARLRRRRSEIADVLDEVYRWMQEGAPS